MSDLMALGAMKYCLDKHIRIPDDISIIGYDDMKFASMLTPCTYDGPKGSGKIGERGI